MSPRNPLKRTSLSEQATITPTFQALPAGIGSNTSDWRHLQVTAEPLPPGRIRRTLLETLLGPIVSHSTVKGSDAVKQSLIYTMFSSVLFSYCFHVMADSVLVDHRLPLRVVEGGQLCFHALLVMLQLFPLDLLPHFPSLLDGLHHCVLVPEQRVKLLPKDEARPMPPPSGLCMPLLSRLLGLPLLPRNRFCVGDVGDFIRSVVFGRADRLSGCVPSSYGSRSIERRQMLHSRYAKIYFCLRSKASTGELPLPHFSIPPSGQTRPAKSSNRKDYSWNAPLSSLPSTWESVPAVDGLACHQAQIAPLDPDQLPPAPAIPMVPMDLCLAQTPTTLPLAQIATYKTKLLELYHFYLNMTTSYLTGVHVCLQKLRHPFPPIKGFLCSQ
ncbi:hypothetical protein EYF80_003113 [Liparis tanakae]|uniref:Uncharacterized protein n=1 Tax=Liparis tanakae TaxID=230148 RepID=A0A4Z2J8E9_9TELE|nr:hypothetical protein EYF80_003113 [Liparis tanakae]